MVGDLEPLSHGKYLNELQMFYLGESKTNV